MCSSISSEFRPARPAAWRASRLHTGAAVVPAFTIWDPVLRKYRVEFERALELVRSGDDEADAIANTALFNKSIRTLCAAISRPMALGTSPVEDAAAGREAAVLRRRIVVRG